MAKQKQATTVAEKVERLNEEQFRSLQMPRSLTVSYGTQKEPQEVTVDFGSATVDDLIALFVRPEMRRKMKSKGLTGEEKVTLLQLKPGKRGRKAMSTADRLKKDLEKKDHSLSELQEMRAIFEAQIKALGG